MENDLGKCKGITICKGYLEHMDRVGVATAPPHGDRRTCSMAYGRDALRTFFIFIFFYISNHFPPFKNLFLCFGAYFRKKYLLRSPYLFHDSSLSFRKSGISPKFVIYVFHFNFNSAFCFFPVWWRSFFILLHLCISVFH